jgi:hypothetical protein
MIFSESVGNGNKSTAESFRCFFIRFRIADDQRFFIVFPVKDICFVIPRRDFLKKS